MISVTYCSMAAQSESGQGGRSEGERGVSNAEQRCIMRLELTEEN
jgi:hypothetical protein